MDRFLTAPCAGLLVMWLSTAALADGGTVRLQTELDDYRLTLFTAPTPLVAGAVDLSVYVECRRTGQPATELAVAFQLRHAAAEPEQQFVATAEAVGPNRLLRTAHVELPQPGRWQVLVMLDPHGQRLTAAGELTVAEPPPAWLAMWPWYCWPAVMVLLFLAGQRGRRGR